MQAAASLATELRNALASIDRYVARADFRGYDPYDALMSPLFGLPLLRSSRYARIVAQQVLKRLPVNLRPVLGIEKHASAVSVARMLEGYAYLFGTDTAERDYYRARIDLCLRRLVDLRSTGFSGDCWGYEFAWEPRYAQSPIPGGFPNVVATGIVSNALFETYRLVGVESALASCVSASEFVMRDLEKTVAPDGSFCWGYFPGDRQLVLNATMKAARLCAQVYAPTRREELREAARATVAFVANHQRDDGAWPYSVGDARKWVDNFHTGYLLDCLHAYEQHTEDRNWSAATAKGWEYYRANFVADDRVPKYLDHRVWPADATACAQTITTLTTFGDVSTAASVARWTLAHMHRADGTFVYQRRPHYANPIAYMRWSIAPMYAALARLLHGLERTAPGPDETGRGRAS